MRELGASEILESDKTPKDEMALARRRGGKWTEIPSQRRTGKVSYSRDDLENITQGRPYSTLHTHPRLEENTAVTDIRQIEDDSMVAAIEAVASMRHAGKDREDNLTDHLEELVKGMRYSPSFPSGQDILIFLGDPQERFIIVTQRDPVTSKVAGYYFMMKGKTRPESRGSPVIMTRQKLQLGEKIRTSIRSGNLLIRPDMIQFLIIPQPNCPLNKKPPTKKWWMKP